MTLARRQPNKRKRPASTHVQTHEAAHGERSRTREFVPSPELKSLFREMAKRIHPDLSRDSADRERGNRLMAEANRAYQAGDVDVLKRVLQEYQDGADAVVGDGIGSELIRVIRQISCSMTGCSDKNMIEILQRLAVIRY